MNVLPDTSVWVDYLRHAQHGSAWPLDILLASGAVVVCGPVMAEILAGARQPTRAHVWSLFQALPWTPLGRNEWYRIGEVAAALRERGMTVPLTDVEIAVSAVAAPAALWSGDTDFERVAQVLPELQRYRPS